MSMLRWTSLAIFLISPVACKTTSAEKPAVTVEAATTSVVQEGSMTLPYDESKELALRMARTQVEGQAKMQKSDLPKASGIVFCSYANGDHACRVRVVITDSVLSEPLALGQ